jgi:PAS domain-containing protein
LDFLFFLYFASVIIASLSTFYRAYRASNSFRNRRRFLLVLASMGIGCTASLDFAASWGIPLRPVGVCRSRSNLVVMLRVVLRYRLVDVTPKLASGRILETMRGAVTVADLEGDIRLVNSAAEQMLGRQKSDILGRGLQEIASLPCREDASSCEAVWTSSGVCLLGQVLCSIRSIC